MKDILSLSQLSAAELASELAKAERELFTTGFRVSQGGEKRTHLARSLKKRIARIKTIQSQQQRSTTKS